MFHSASNNISSATPETILPRLFGKLPHDHSRKNNNYVNPHNWPYFRSNDGRHGQVLCVPLPDDPDGCMACSRQIAVNCTTTHVIQAYLSAHLQHKWNRRHVHSVSFHPVSSELSRPDHRVSCVRQDLVLHSQRVLRGQTGPLKYSQRLTIHKIMMHPDDNDNEDNDPKKNKRRHWLSTTSTTSSTTPQSSTTQQEQQQQPHYNVLVELIPSTQNEDVSESGDKKRRTPHYHCPFRQLTVNVRPIQITSHEMMDDGNQRSTKKYFSCRNHGLRNSPRQSSDCPQTRWPPRIGGPLGQSRDALVGGRICRATQDTANGGRRNERGPQQGNKNSIIDC